METVELACEKRAVRPKGLVNRIRREGRVPAVIYGNHGSAVAVAVGGVELKARVSTASRQRIMRLKSDSPELNDKHVILKEIQRTPVSGDILHADFYEVDLNKPMRVPVAFRFIGRAAGIVDGGILLAAGAPGRDRMPAARNSRSRSRLTSPRSRFTTSSTSRRCSSR